MRQNPENFTEFQVFVTQYMSLLFEEHGYSPLVGKIFTLLLFAPGPLCLQEIAGRLGVSKAAVSVQVRAMERMALCFKAANKNDRRDYYYISDDLCVTILRAKMLEMQKVRESLDQTLSLLSGLKGLQSDEQESLSVFERRYAELSDLYGLVAKRLQGLEEEWRQRHG
ncbi:GbsR/MarR family transcriptional regulator [Paenibacillus hamazuiensis]|uniref:GbsR/MarR family transcriptional regulator n=1 Tax=Paenibacillus hamazuiensis TaxID=2936508 RepID=UPI00200C3E38|nr:MarR family transcriptional regulator [Paenibacillus hamazuiensis]